MIRSIKTVYVYNSEIRYLTLMKFIASEQVDKKYDNSSDVADDFFLFGDYSFVFLFSCYLFKTNLYEQTDWYNYSDRCKSQLALKIRCR